MKCHWEITEQSDTSPACTRSTNNSGPLLSQFFADVAHSLQLLYFENSLVYILIFIYEASDGNLLPLEERQ